MTQQEICAFCRSAIYGGEHCWHSMDGHERCPSRDGSTYPFHQPQSEIGHGSNSETPDSPPVDF